MDYEETCMVQCVSNKKKLPAEILEFKPQAKLVVSVNRSFRLVLTWSGRYYEGRNSGLDFESDGPLPLRKSMQGLRG